MYKSTCSFLLSYAWLIRYKSDFDIAIAHALVPNKMEWETWIDILDTFFDHADHKTFENISKRYMYGELSLSRLYVI